MADDVPYFSLLGSPPGPTFNGKLEFNAHVHVMLTAGGLDTSGEWLPSVYYDVDALTHYWRKGVIRLLRARLRSRATADRVA